MPRSGSEVETKVVGLRVETRRAVRGPGVRTKRVSGDFGVTDPGQGQSPQKDQVGTPGVEEDRTRGAPDLDPWTPHHSLSLGDGTWGTAHPLGVVYVLFRVE